MMYKIALAALLIAMSWTALPAQEPAPNGTKVITISNTGIKDCVYHDGRIWLLDSSGVVWSVDESDWSARKVYTGPFKIVAIGHDSLAHIIVADSTGLIMRAGGKDTVQLYKTGQNILKLLFTADNDLYAICDKGIFIPDDDRIYYENAFSNFFFRYKNSYGWQPACYFVDKEQNIWLGFDKGEWGGDIVIFSTAERQFMTLTEKGKKRCSLYPVRSIFQVDNAYFVTTSLQHMSSLRSALLNITDSCRLIFESSRFDSINYYNGHSIYMGPALYNPSDSSIYFYCGSGVFKSRDKHHISSIGDWIRLFETNLLWSYGQPAAVGYDMNVTDMLLGGDKLFLISPGNGELIWNGKEKILLK